MLEMHNVSYRVGSKYLVRDVNLQIESGRVCALLGPNGAGKSTLVKMMSGQLSCSAGEVKLCCQSLQSFDAPALACKRSVLSQSRSVGFTFTAFDVALMGRHPRITGGGESAKDREITAVCLKRTDAWHLADRIYNTLSGGEAARVDLARVLAQEADLLLLDEPTNHLDPRHQVAVLQLCREVADEGCAVAVCMHDLNLAAQYADDVMVLKDGRAVAHGAPAEVLTAELLEEVYEMPFLVWPHPVRGICIMPDTSGGNGATQFATNEEFVAHSHI